jgi:sulfate permease, SulP family
MTAVVEAWRAGYFQRAYLPSNILAGIIVGVVSLPLAMAFAIASGVKPEQGLYTAIVAGLIVTLFGGSRVQVAGPTGAFIVVLSGIVATHGLAGLQLATLMAGGLLVLMGFLRMGAVIRYIPAPVIVGFTAGIGVIIWVGQWPAFFGIPDPSGSHFHEKLPSLIGSLPGLHLTTTLLALAGLLILIVAPKIQPLQRIPAPLIAMLVVTGLNAIFHFDGVATIGTRFGGIPTGLPGWTPPTLAAGDVVDLIGPAVTIAMLCAIESLLSAVVADGMSGTRHDSNQELVGQGLANIASPLLGGIAATGAIARTATSIRNGGTSPVAGLANVVVLVAIVLLLAPLASAVPLAALAAILFVVAWNMSDVRHVVRMARRAPAADVAIMATTFLLTVFADLVIAVNVGVLLATLHFLRRMSQSVDVSHAGEHAEGDGAHTHVLPQGVVVYSIDGPFFFAAVDALDRAIARNHEVPRALVIRLGRVPFIDITGIQGLESAIADAHRRGARVVLCEANPRVTSKLRRAGIVRLVGEDRVVGTIGEALAAATDAAPGSRDHAESPRRIPPPAPSSEALPRRAL